MTSSSFNTNANTSFTSSYAPYRTSSSYRSLTSNNSLSNFRPLSSREDTIPIKKKLLCLNYNRQCTDNIYEKNGRPLLDSFSVSRQSSYKKSNYCFYPSSPSSGKSVNVNYFAKGTLESYGNSYNINIFYDDSDSDYHRHYCSGLRKKRRSTIHDMERYRKKKITKQLTKISEIANEIKNNNSSILSVKGSKKKIILTNEDKEHFDKKLEEFNDSSLDGLGDFSLLLNKDINDNILIDNNCLDDEQPEENIRVKKIIVTLEDTFSDIEEKKNKAEIMYNNKLCDYIRSQENILLKSFNMTPVKKYNYKDSLLDNIKEIPKEVFTRIKNIIYPKYPKKYFKHLFKHNQNYKIENNTYQFNKLILSKYLHDNEIYHWITKKFSKKNTLVLYPPLSDKRNYKYLSTTLISNKDYKISSSQENININNLKCRLLLTSPSKKKSMSRQKIKQTQCNGFFEKAIIRRNVLDIINLQNSKTQTDSDIKVYYLSKTAPVSKHPIKIIKKNFLTLKSMPRNSKNESDIRIKQMQTELNKDAVLSKTMSLISDKKYTLSTMKDILFYLIKEKDFGEFQRICSIHIIDYEAKNEDGNSYLNFSVLCNEYDFVLFLLQRGAEVNTTNNEMNTPLHNALHNRNFKIADLLLSHKANEHCLNIYKQTPWQYIN